MSYKLVILNKTEQTYVIIAKSLGGEWNLGNVDVLKSFLESSIRGADEFVIGEQGDLDLSNAENFNKVTGWKYAE